MTKQIVFCSDSILRLKEEFDNVMLPLISIEKDNNEKSKKEDPFFILPYFKNEVLIEEGTTLSDILLAIAPWSEILGKYLNVDLDAYITEFRKPSEVLRDEQLSWIGIGRSFDFNLSFKIIDDVDESSDEDFDQSFIFSEQQESDELEDNFNFVESLYASAYIKGEDGHFSFYDIDRIKGLPVYLKNKTEFISYEDDDIKQNLFNNEAHSLIKEQNIRIIEAVSDFNKMTFINVLEAIFDNGFGCYSPQMLKKEIREAQEAIESSDKTIRDTTDEELKVVFSTNVESDIINMIGSRMESWDSLKKEISSRKDVVMRIGALKEGIAPEKRIYGKIIK